MRCSGNRASSRAAPEAYRADGGSFISVQLFTFRAEAFGTLLAGSAIKRK